MRSPWRQPPARGGDEAGHHLRQPRDLERRARGQALAEALGAPVATDQRAGRRLDAHPLAVGVVGSNGGTRCPTRSIVERADLVMFIGCRAGSVTTEALGAIRSWQDQDRACRCRRLGHRGQLQDGRLDHWRHLRSAMLEALAPQDAQVLFASSICPKRKLGPAIAAARKQKWKCVPRRWLRPTTHRSSPSR